MNYILVAIGTIIITYIVTAITLMNRLLIIRCPACSRLTLIYKAQAFKQTREYSCAYCKTPQRLSGGTQVGWNDDIT